MNKTKKRQLLQIWTDLNELNFHTYFIGYYETKYNFVNELIIDCGSINRSVHLYFGRKNKLTNLTVISKSYNHKTNLKIKKGIIKGRIADSTKHFLKLEGKVSKQFRLKWAKIFQKEVVSMLVNPVVKLASKMATNSSGDTLSNALKLFEQIKKEDKEGN